MAKQPKIKLPEGYTDEAEFLAEMRLFFWEDWAADEKNRIAAAEDAKFVAGEQWDPRDKARRIRNRKPVVTINRLPALIGQVIGNRRLNKTEIKVLPDINGTRVVAEIREGLIRNAQKVSNADIAYDTALQNAAMVGIGGFGLSLDYAYDDVFEQDMNIVQNRNPLAYLWDRHMQDPTGKDAQRFYEIGTMSRKVFNKKYPWASAGDLQLDSSFMSELVEQQWVTLSDVRVVRYWRMRSRQVTLALLEDGTTLDVSKMQPEEYLGKVQLDRNGEPYVRVREKLYAQMYVCTGISILEGPYDLPISRVPHFRVPGYEIAVGETVERFGITRWAKDPQRFHNYWRSVQMERLQMSPKNKWIASNRAVAGREDEWRKSHLSDDPLLIFNEDSMGAPTRSPSAPMEPALMEQSMMAVQDIRDVTNMHEASMGQVSNEVSGKAIRERQSVAELGIVVYLDNLNMAIEECGRVMNELVPIVYDTPRKVRILGEDMREKIMEINVSDDNDVTLGKYSVTTITGPSYATKRQEAADNMLNMVNAMPDTLQSAADLIIENQDWPGAEKISRRLRKSLPPELLEAEDLTEEEQAQLQQAQQQAQAKAAEVEAMEKAKFDTDLTYRQAQAREADARAAEAEARAAKAYQSVDMDQVRLYLESRKVLLAEQNAETKAENDRTKLAVDTMTALNARRAAEGA